MDGSREGGGALKPVILRVCVGIVLSAAGLILARFVFWKEDTKVTSSTSNPESSSSGSGRDDGDEEVIESQDHLKQEILSLQTRFEELQRKKYEMDLRFQRYCNLKEKEVMLMEHESLLSNEKCQLDFFRKEVAAMEQEYKRGNDLVIVYFKLVGKIQELTSENGLLEGKTKKLRRRTKQLSRVVSDKNRRIIGVQTKFLKCIDNLKTNNNIVKKLADEVEDLKAIVATFSYSQPEMMLSVDEYTRFLQDYEDLKKYENERHEGNHHDVSLELTVTDRRHEENRHETSRRRRMLNRLKTWIEGHEKGKSTKAEDRCFGWLHSLTVVPEEEGEFHSKRSCSSV